MGPPKTLDATDFISRRFNLPKYVLIESRDPFEYGDARYLYDMARGLAEKDNDVTVFLIQNGVMTTRPRVKDNPLPGVARHLPAIKVPADDFSLRERGISLSTLEQGVEISDIDYLVDLLVQEDAKIVWH